MKKKLTLTVLFSLVAGSGILSAQEPSGGTLIQMSGIGLFVVLMSFISVNSKRAKKQRKE